MKNKILLVFLAAIMLFSLSACGAGTSDNPEITDDPEISAKPAETSEPEESPESSETAEPESESGSGNYSNKVYYVGEDIPAGGYVINCTSTDYSMDIIVFASAEDYEGFQHAEKSTVGEFSEAVELHAWANFYLDLDEKVYVGLREGYIILLDDGKCEFNKYDLSTSQTIYSGIYVVGEDIDAEKINILCISDYLKVTLFSGKDRYLDYHKTSRFTIGEESDAIEEYADSTDYIYTDDSTYANLQDGMIMMVEKGTGEYSIDEGPIIN